MKIQKLFGLAIVLAFCGTVFVKSQIIFNNQSDLDVSQLYSVEIAGSCGSPFCQACEESGKSCVTDRASDYEPGSSNPGNCTVYQPSYDCCQ